MMFAQCAAHDTGTSERAAARDRTYVHLYTLCPIAIGMVRPEAIGTHSHTLPMPSTASFSDR
jgi:hypothetical protein